MRSTGQVVPQAIRSLSQMFGKAWLETNGWDFVWWFSEHDNIRRVEESRKYILHPFDYYAERGDETWFIDAKKSWTDVLNKAVIEPYLRRHKIGFLFVLPDASRVIFREIVKVTGGINVTMAQLGLKKKAPGRPKHSGGLEIVDVKNLPDLDALRAS